jgi:glycosyltransferase involved in cell wall biosynthesis
MPEFVDQVIVVDNASTDRTSEIARSFGAQVIREEVRGYGRSYKKGFTQATGDIIVTLDGDHSYPPDAISYLLEAFLHLEVDFLNASRFPVRDKRAMSLKHKLGNLVLSLGMSLLFFRWVRDSQSAWVIRRSILREMTLISDGMAFSEEIKVEAIRHARIRFEEISIQYSSRLGEKKLNPWRDGFHNLWFLVRKRFYPGRAERRVEEESWSG